jgi:phosphoribosylformimino-5-aminoimidazole carboxamide ribotide isomerase
MRATDLAKEFADVGVEAIICTDIGRDGMLSGVNVEFTREVQEASGVETIASGGVKDIEDIEALMDSGIDGVIIGKAFYEGTIDLREAFRLANGER